MWVWFVSDLPSLLVSSLFPLFQCELDWSFIVRTFDRKENVMDTPAARPLLIAVLTLPPQAPASRAPIMGLLDPPIPWQNTLAFYRIFTHLIIAPPSVFSLASIPALTHLIKPEDFAETSTETQALAGEILRSSWNTQEGIKVFSKWLKSVMDDEERENGKEGDVVKEVLKRGIAMRPECVLVGLVQQPVSFVPSVRYQMHDRGD